MSVVNISHKGDFSKTFSFLNKSSNISNLFTKTKIKSLAKEGVEELSRNTPVRTGKTADSWNYEIVENNGRIIVIFTNDNIVNGINIAIILQYGHGTRNGGYVQGIDYINPSLQSIFEKMADDMWKAVVSS